MKKNAILSMILTAIFLASAMPMHAAEQPVKQPQKLSLRQRALKQYSESMARLQKCRKLKCNRSEFLKASRDVSIAVGVVLAAVGGGKALQHAYSKATPQVSLEKFVAWRVPIGHGVSKYGSAQWSQDDREKFIQLIKGGLTPRDDYLVSAIIAYDKDLFDALMERGVDSNKLVQIQGRSFPPLFYAILHQNAYAVKRLLDKMAITQIIQKYEGWNACQYARQLATQPWKFPNVYIGSFSAKKPYTSQPAQAQAIVGLLEAKEGACSDEEPQGRLPGLHWETEMADIYTFENTYLP